MKQLFQIKDSRPYRVSNHRIYGGCRIHRNSTNVFKVVLDKANLTVDKEEEQGK